MNVLELKPIVDDWLSTQNLKDLSTVKPIPQDRLEGLSAPIDFSSIQPVIDGTTPEPVCGNKARILYH
jgi:hypothetical protein